MLSIIEAMRDAIAEEERNHEVLPSHGASELTPSSAATSAPPLYSGAHMRQDDDNGLSGIVKTLSASDRVISICPSTSTGKGAPSSSFWSACKGAWRGSPDDTLDADSRSEDKQRLHDQYECACGCIVRVPDFDGSSIASAKAYLERCTSGRQTALQILRTAVGNAYTSSRDIRTGAALDPEADMRDYLLPLV